MFIGTRLGHYASVLQHWLWLIGLTIGVCTGLTYIVNLLTPPVYEASALIQVHDASTTNSNVFTDQALAQSYALLINRPTVLHLVAQRIPKLTIYELEAAISDSPLDNTQIIQVRATAKDPNLAATITNTVVDVFIKIQIDEETTHLKGVATKLYKDLTTAKQGVYTDQAQLVALQDAHASQDRIAHQNDVLNGDQVSYNSLLMNYDQVQQQLLQVSSILTVAQVATPPNTPGSPRTFLNTITAAALSGVVIVVFVLLLDWMDASIKTADDVEQLTQIKSLGGIPFCKNIPRFSTSTISPIINSAMIEQAFVGIAASTIILSQGLRSILVTGPRKKSGISTVAANLAIVLARSGVRVLLVDANLRTASLSRVFKNSNTSSLTTILNEFNMFQSGLTQQVYSWLNQLSTHIPNLFFLPSGSTSTTSGTIFLSSNISLFLNCLLKTAQNSTYKTSSGPVDIIIFDSASLDDTTDTLALASSVDSSILVINSGKENAITLNKAYTTLDRFSCTPLGVIVNRQKLKHKSYFYPNHTHQLPIIPNGQVTKMMKSDLLQTVADTQNAPSPLLIHSETSTTLAGKTSISTVPLRSTNNQNFGQVLGIPFTEHKNRMYKE